VFIAGDPRRCDGLLREEHQHDSARHAAKRMAKEAKTDRALGTPHSVSWSSGPMNIDGSEAAAP
jgi:hypothetical protein